MGENSQEREVRTEKYEVRAETQSTRMGTFQTRVRGVGEKRITFIMIFI